MPVVNEEQPKCDAINLKRSKHHQYKTEAPANLFVSIYQVIHVGQPWPAQEVNRTESFSLGDY